MIDATFFTSGPGYPQPFGVSENDKGINFALFSKHAQSVSLCLFSHDSKTPFLEVLLSPTSNKTGDVWHILLNHLPDNIYYAYRVDKAANLLLDPYAKELSTGNVWEKPTISTIGTIIRKQHFDWSQDTPPNIPLRDLIIYEMHVRGFTEHPSSEVNYKGSFLGITEKIPYLKDLGINAVELLPIQEWNELEYNNYNPVTNQLLCNYWGYSTINFFSPMKRYASSELIGSAIKDFKTMVKMLHKHQIEVILDVVFNHTGEGGENGPTLSFKGLDKSVYYLLDTQGNFLDFTGCSNTVNCNHPVVQEMIIDCLRYWVLEMHVDGFRFDLASVLVRGTKGELHLNSPILEAISHDPILGQTKLIAEPWDAVGVYQVGSFYSANARWSEWNGRYRDSVRRFIKGDHNVKGDFATRICGSQDLYGNCQSPSSSINFITAHDGFTLADLVSYNQKHNKENGEENRDGNNQNDSWNCGVEGPSLNQKVIALRERQMRNLILALMVSQGVPMLLMGDEYAHTKQGNNNTWCQDNDSNWFLWNQLSLKKDFFRFYRACIHFRQAHKTLFQRDTFLEPDDVEWHGIVPEMPNWDVDDRFIAWILKDHQVSQDVYIAFNASDKIANVELPVGKWLWIANTANLPPSDFYDPPVPVQGDHYKMAPHSAIVLKKNT